MKPCRKKPCLWAPFLNFIKERLSFCTLAQEHYDSLGYYKFAHDAEGEIKRLMSELSDLTPSIYG